MKPAEAAADDLGDGLGLVREGREDDADAHGDAVYGGKGHADQIVEGSEAARNWNGRADGTRDHQEHRVHKSQVIDSSETLGHLLTHRARVHTLKSPDYGGAHHPIHPPYHQGVNHEKPAFFHPQTRG